MPSDNHELPASYIVDTIIDKIDALPGQPVNSVVAAAASAFRLEGGNRKKEGDQCIRPRLQRMGTGSWASVMIEVGYSQTLASLQSDATIWLDKSYGHIRIVLIAKVRRNPLRIRLQAWRIGSTGHRRTRQTRSEAPMVLLLIAGARVPQPLDHSFPLEYVRT